MQIPLLSIIVPIYNTEKYLDSCIESILHQDYKNIEILLIDDGSTDNSGDICDQYAIRDKRVRVVHQKNQGQGAARNTGISFAKGNYITFVDSDDKINSDLYSIGINIMESASDIDIYQFPCMKIINGNHDKAQYVLKKIVFGGEQAFIDWLNTHAISNYVCNKIFRASYLLKFRFPTNMIFEDRFIMSDILDQCKRIYINDKGMYYYNIHEAQTTQRPRDPFFLSSLIKADLNIVIKIKNYKSLRSHYIERFSNCIYYKKLLENQGQQMNDIIKKEMKGNAPSISSIVHSSSPIGLKLRCLKFILSNLVSNTKLRFIH